jgi:cell division protein FtsB
MKNFRFNWKSLVVVGAFVAFFFLLMDFNGRINELNRLNNELSKLETQVQANKSTESALNEAIQYATSEGAVNAYARNNGLIQSGEKLIVPLGDSTPQPSNILQPTPTPIKVTNRDIWWALFFGD